MPENEDELMEKDEETSKEDEEVTKKHPLPSVRELKEEDLGNYTFADIVIPLPGWKVTYPSYAKNWYQELLERDELPIDLQFNNK